MSDGLLSDADLGIGSPVGGGSDKLLSDADVGLPSANPAVDQARAERAQIPEWAGKTDAFVRGAANSVPFAEDFAALGDTATSYLPEGVKSYIPGINQTDQSGEPFAQRYRENLARQRAISQADIEDRPIPALGGLFAGALSLPLGIANRAARTVAGAVRPYVGATASSALGSAAVGSGLGGLYGLGSGDSIGDRAERALAGAGIGGAAGAVLPVLGAGARAAVKPLAPYLPAWAGGKDAAIAAANRIGSALRTDADAGATGMSAADLRAARATGQSPVLADIGGETTRGLARTAANASPEARAAISETANDRFAEQGNRFSQFMQDLFGSRLNAQDARDALSKSRAATNTPAYARAYSAGANGIWDKDLSHMMQSPDMQDAVRSAMRKAQTSAVVEGNAVVKNPFVQDDAGNVVLAKGPNGETATPSLQFWDHVKRALDDKIGAARRSGAMDDARLLGGLKDSLVSKLDAAVPEYADARLGAFKLFGAENALEAGENFLGMSNVAKIDAVKSSLGKMSPDQREFFAQGLASQIMQKAQNAGERRNIVGLFNSPETLEKMQAGLGQQRSNEIEAFLRRESMMDMLRTSLGNSTTARQLHDLQEGGHGVSGIIGQAASPLGGAAAGVAYQYHEHGFDPVEMGKGAIGGAVGGLMAQYVKGVRSDIVRNIGEQLASNDPQVWRRAVQASARNPQIMEGMRRVESGLTAIAGRQGAAFPAKYEELEPQSRASGGRVSKRDYPAKKAAKIEGRAARALRALGGELRPLMDEPDHVMASALRIANRS